MIFTPDQTNTNVIQMWSPSEFSSKFGSNFDAGKDFVGVMNSNYSANAIQTLMAAWDESRGVLLITNQAAKSHIQVNYVVIVRR